MELFQGTEGFGEVAFGVICCLKNRKDIEKVSTNSDKSSVDIEYERYEVAKSYVDPKLLNIYDNQLENAILARIYNQKFSAKKAIISAGEYLEEILSTKYEEYVSSGGADIKNITQQLLMGLKEAEQNYTILPERSIIVADSLSAAEFLKLDKTRICGLIMDNSSVNSHTAVLAKAMNIPTIIGCEVDSKFDGEQAFIDGGWRVLYVNPDDQTIADMNERINEAESEKNKLLELMGRECITKDGRSIHLYANICSVDEVASANSNDAEGIGLYRTEAVYLNRRKAPLEDELFAEYKMLASSMGNKGVTIRTLDLNSSKDIPYIDLNDEGNSALGVRGIRFCFKYPEIFKTQIRAVLRAAVYGKMSIMFPMISSVNEFVKAKKIVEECHRDLLINDIPSKMVELGVMIETPAAVMISQELASMSDFLSIGTNDLTQYTLGVDRDNKDLTDICDYRHPAILKMIEIVCKNAHECNVPVGICGELASDEGLTDYFLNIGVDSLSISPNRILAFRNHILEL